MFATSSSAINFLPGKDHMQKDKESQMNLIAVNSSLITLNAIAVLHGAIAHCSQISGRLCDREEDQSGF